MIVTTTTTTTTITTTARDLIHPCQDGVERLEAERALRSAEADAAVATAQSSKLRAASVADNPMNGPGVALLNGLDPQSPYVTQRPGQNYFWYKTSEGEVERRDAGEPLAKVWRRPSPRP